MQINIQKLNLILAKRCTTTANLRSGVSSVTIAKIMRGEEVRPDVVGRIAAKLGVDPTEILEEERT